MSTAGDWSRDPLGDAERRRARGAVPWGRAEEAGEEWPPLRAAPPETPPDPQDDVETTSYISSLRDRQSPDGEWYRASPQYGTRAARRREANPADDYGNAVGHEPGPATPPPPAPVSGYRGASDTSGWLPPALPPTTYRKVAPRDDDSTYSTGAHRQVDYDIDGRPMGYRALPSGHEDPPRDLSLDDGTRDDGSYGATTYGASGTTYTGAAGTTYTGNHVRRRRLHARRASHRVPGAPLRQRRRWLRHVQRRDPVRRRDHLRRWQHVRRRDHVRRWLPGPGVPAAAASAARLRAAVRAGDVRAARLRPAASARLRTAGI